MADICKQFGTKDATGRWKARTILDGTNISKVNGTKLVQRWLNRCVGPGGISLGWGTKEPDTLRWVGRCAVEQCDCTVPTSLSVSISGCSGDWITQGLYTLYSYLPNDVASYYSSVFLGYSSKGQAFVVSAAGADVSLANGTYNCDAICPGDCGSLYASDWEIVDTSVVNGQSWYVEGCCDQYHDPPEDYTMTYWTQTDYLWIRVIASCGVDAGGPNLEGNVFILFAISEASDEPPVTGDPTSVLYNPGLGFGAGSFGSYASEDCDLTSESCSNLTGLTGADVPSSFASCNLTTDTVFSGLSISVTGGTSGPYPHEGCPGEVTVCIRSCCDADGCAEVYIKQGSTTVYHSEAQYGCFTYSLEPGTYTVLVYPCQDTGLDVVTDWAMQSGELSESENVTVYGLSTQVVEFYVKPVFDAPHLKISNIPPAECNGGYPDSLYVANCAAGGGIYQLPIECFNGTWEISAGDDENEQCGWERHFEVEGTYWDNCTPTTGTLHYFIKMYYGKHAINPSTGAIDDTVYLLNDSSCHWIVYISVYVNESLTCIPTAYAYYYNSSTNITYPYDSGSDTTYHLLTSSYPRNAFTAGLAQVGTYIP